MKIIIKILCFFVPFFILFLSCNKEDEGVRYFEEDPDCPDLPIPSMKGYNVWGVVSVKGEKETFQVVGKGQRPACKVEVMEDTLSMYFNGLSGADTIGYCFKMHLSDTVRTYLDLKFFKDSVINYDTESCKFLVRNNNGEYVEANATDGFINFVAAMPVKVDGDTIGLILAGGFETDFAAGKSVVSLRRGRFDFLIDSTNFEVLKKDTFSLDSLSLDSIFNNDGGADTIIFVPLDSVTSDSVLSFDSDSVDMDIPSDSSPTNKSIDLDSLLAPIDSTSLSVEGKEDD